MSSRRYRGLLQGSNNGRDGVVAHREHRSKKGRTPVQDWQGIQQHKKRKAKLIEKEHRDDINKYI